MDPKNPNSPQHDAANDDYDRKFNKKLSLKDQEENPTAVDNKNEATSLKDKEKAPTTHKVTISGKKGGAKPSKIRQMIGSARHKSAMGFVTTMLLLGIGYAAIFAPNIIMVNIKEMFTNDLADATVALYTYNKKMMNHKIGKADCGDTESIQCRLSTMPRSLKLAFDRAGFKVNGEKVEEDNLDDRDRQNDKPESRFKVTSIEYPNGAGTATSGDQFYEIADKSSALKTLAYSVFNPKSSFFTDERYLSRIKEKYDLTKSIDVSGATAKEVDESFNAALKGDDEGLDEAGRGGVGLFTLKEDSTKNQIRTLGVKLGETAHSYTQLQCSFYTIGRVANNSIPTAKEQTIARFAMIFLKAADQIKDGRSNEITTNTLSDKLAWSDGGGYGGKNATDASMYRTILEGDQIRTSQYGNKFYLNSVESIGATNIPWLLLTATSRAVGSIAGAPGGLSSEGDLGTSARQYCLSGQTQSNKQANKFPSNCPALATASAFPQLTGAVAPAAALGERTCPPPPRGIFQMYPSLRLTHEILSAFVADQFSDPVTREADRLSGDFSAKTKGVAASDALFAGTGAILGDMAMSRGMRPGDKNSMKTYLAHEESINNEYEELARYEAKQNPFDVYNKYTFAGSLAYSFSLGHGSESPFTKTVGTLLGMIPTALKTATNSTANAFYYIQPLTFDENRLNCKDQGYTNIGIMADVACNIRYSMSNEELDADVNSVVDYMTQPHPDESQDGVDELQQRLGRTDPELGLDTGDVSRQLSQARQGNQAAFIDEKTGKANKFTEYEKYLEFCVNREDPWGRTGTVIQRERISQEEQDLRIAGKKQDGTPINADGEKDAYEKIVTAGPYMAVTEGSSMDQDWYTGKKCLENSEMLKNFRAYTMMCSVDGSYSGGADCTEKDRASFYSDSFYTGNDILFTSWW